MHHLQALSLESYFTPNIHSIIPSVCQLNQLQRLRLQTLFERDTFDAFLNSMEQLQNLREIDITWPWVVNSEDLDDIYKLAYFRDEDLKRFKCLKNLEKFKLYGPYCHITLPGILEVLRDCPKWTVLWIEGFRQNISSDDGITVIDDDIYEKFRQAYYEKEREDVTIRSNASFEIPNKFKYKWYSLGIANYIDLFKKCL